MIIDTLDNFQQYISVNPLFEKVAEFISQNDLAGMNEGKYPILGDNLFVTITTAQSKTPDKAQDMPEAEYDAEKDIVKTPGVIAESFVTCQPGMFAVFFPQDGHAPCIAMQPNIKKAIFKVKHQ